MSRRNNFDFAHTCPKIDKAIGECKDTLKECLASYIESICPYISKDTINSLSMEWSREMYHSISHCFESVRETNEEMRDAANDQISNLQGEIEELNSQIKDLEDRADELDYEIRDLKSQRK